MFTEETARDAIDTTFDDVCDYSVRNYGHHLKKMDVARLKKLRESGTRSLKLMFVLAMLTHDASLREQIEDDASLDIVDKVKSFYRVLAIVMRSIYVSPFTERSAKRLVFDALRFCFLTWKCFDAKGIVHLCDWYSARCD